MSNTVDKNNPDNGLYEVFWESGGSSLASIGRYPSGDIWIAPTNWINGSVNYKEKKSWIKKLRLIEKRN